MRPLPKKCASHFPVHFFVRTTYVLFLRQLDVASPYRHRRAQEGDQAVQQRLGKAEVRPKVVCFCCCLRGDVRGHMTVTKDAEPTGALRNECFDAHLQQKEFNLKLDFKFQPCKVENRESGLRILTLTGRYTQKSCSNQPFSSLWFKKVSSASSEHRSRGTSSRKALRIVCFADDKDAPVRELLAPWMILKDKTEFDWLKLKIYIHHFLKFNAYESF